MRQFFFGDDARAKILEGVETLYRAVACTLGPRGRNVLIDQHPHPNIPVHLTKDGVTVSKEIVAFNDPVFETGAKVIREAASKTSDLAGDGTTTSVVLAYSIFAAGLIELKKGANPVALKRGIDMAVEACVVKLKRMAKEISSDEELVNVGRISSNGDEEIGKLVCEAFRKIGKQGVITISEGQDAETKLNFIEGMQFDRGLTIAPQVFATDRARMQCRMENPYILVTERKILDPKPVMKLMEQIAAESPQRPLLVLGGDFDQPFIVFLIANWQQGNLRALPVKAPSFGIHQRGCLEDIAVLTGATAFTDNADKRLEQATLKDLGSASHVVCTPTDTTIVGGRGDAAELRKRIELLSTEISLASNDLERERYKQRYARLTTGVAHILVGGYTETEIKEKKDRVDDAVCAVRAAAEEGIVPGGGVALLHCVNELRSLDITTGGDVNAGVKLIRSAIESPIRTICENAGEDPEEIDRLIRNLETLPWGMGIDYSTAQMVNLLDYGIIDPCKVTRVALQNAASVAAALLTTECVITQGPATAQG